MKRMKATRPTVQVTRRTLLLMVFAALTSATAWGNPLLDGLVGRWSVVATYNEGKHKWSERWLSHIRKLKGDSYHEVTYEKGKRTKTSESWLYSNGTLSGAGYKNGKPTYTAKGTWRAGRGKIVVKMSYEKGRARRDFTIRRVSRVKYRAAGTFVSRGQRVRFNSAAIRLGTR